MDKLKSLLCAEVYTGKDYLRFTKNEAIAKKLFRKKLKDAVSGAHIVYVISEKEHLPLLPDDAFRVLVTHYIRLDFLEQVVLYEVNRLASFANEYEDDFLKAMLGRSAKVTENDRVRKQRDLDGLVARDKELDALFERLYEDNVSGKIDDARFAKMSKRYEQEQGEIGAKVKALRLELKKTEGQRMDVEEFLETVRRYTNVTTITQRMVAELIDHIDVYHAEKHDGITTQQVIIHYNCVGPFMVPDRRKIPETDIIMETRKGVALSYAPAQIAV